MQSVQGRDLKLYEAVLTFNPGQNSWETNAIVRQNDTFSLHHPPPNPPPPPPPPVQC